MILIHNIPNMYARQSITSTWYLGTQFLSDSPQAAYHDNALIPGNPILIRIL